MASGSSAVRDPLRVAVVGGGVAGLSAAYFVEKYATEAGLRVDTHLLEAQERVGGHIVSEHKDGFLIEGGPDCFLSRKPGGMELVRDCLLYTSDAADDLLCVDLGGRRIIKKKKNNR